MSANPITEPKLAIPGSVSVGALDGRTIIRFAHAFAAGGGVERYLDDLDRTLLKRNSMTIVRIFIGDPDLMEQTSESIGRGILVKVPLPLQDGKRQLMVADGDARGSRWRILFRDWILYNAFVWRLYTKRYLEKWKIKRRPGQVIGAGQAVAALISGRHVDLTMLHYFGGADADEIVELLLEAKMPYALLNHFSNDRFLNLSIRKHALLASGVAGVNSIGVPRYLRKNFCNLSDGIDTDFFRRSEGSLPAQLGDLPLVLLPARMVRTKGHLDLVTAAAALGREGIEIAVGLVGRPGSPTFNAELQSMIDEHGLRKRVHVVGEVSVECLRSWYKAACIVAFPSYHHEGLPRVLLEAQSMQVPVLAYATGGTGEGLISGETGYLLRMGDIGGLINRLRELLADSQLRVSMGLSGRKMVEKQFSIEALAHRHERFYLQVISAKRILQ